MKESISINKKLSTIPLNKEWAFAEKTIKDTSYITHGYYTYPAKFIPQLAQKLILEYSNEEDIIVDPFMGSGTTIVEAIVNKRVGIGVDINNLAYLVAKTKTTPIQTNTLQKEFVKILMDIESRANGQFDFFVKDASKKISKNERIDYWFKKEQKEKLSIIFSRLLEIQNKNIQEFFFVSFAQILKSCSIWLQKSVKPTRDFKKRISDPFQLFVRQSQKMIKKHSEFEKLLPSKVKENIEQYRIIKCEDSRNIPCKDGNATLIITSPPYVTSYEYADLHQLPSIWFSYFEQLSDFRKKFIGSAYKERENIDLKSSIAANIVNEFGNNKKGKEVRNYFADMLESFLEIKRILKTGGKACIVIGNTQFRGINILNAEVFQEQFQNIGFNVHRTIHREIPSKMLPSTRDPETGQFVKVTENKKLAYPSEYILVMEKK